MIMYGYILSYCLANIVILYTISHIILLPLYLIYIRRNRLSLLLLILYSIVEIFKVLVPNYFK